MVFYNFVLNKSKSKAPCPQGWCVREQSPSFHHGFWERCWVSCKEKEPFAFLLECWGLSLPLLVPSSVPWGWWRRKLVCVWHWSGAEEGERLKILFLFFGSADKNIISDFSKAVLLQTAPVFGRPFQSRAGLAHSELSNVPWLLTFQCSGGLF